MMGLTEKLARNLRKPSFGFYGSVVRMILVANKDLTTTAVKLLQVEPDHNVLEVGFGPGHGLKAVLDSGLREGNGKLYGVDFSEAICRHATKSFQHEISSGKLEIRNEDVAKQSFEDEIFDKIFHTQSHIYWPDLNAACAELFRVMKSGGDMANVMNLKRTLSERSRPVLKYATNLVPDKYMEALEASGFENVKLKTIPMGRWKTDLTGILCSKPRSQ